MGEGGLIEREERRWRHFGRGEERGTEGNNENNFDARKVPEYFRLKF